MTNITRTADHSRTIFGAALTLVALNEVRGIVMAAPILSAMYSTGASWLQAWLLLCVAVSLVVPVIVWRKCRG